MPTVIVLAVLFAIGNFYMIFRAIHDIGREDVQWDIIEIALLDIPDIVPADTLPDKGCGDGRVFNRFNQKENGNDINKLKQRLRGEIPGFAGCSSVPRCDVWPFSHRPKKEDKQKEEKCGLQHRTA